MEEQKYFNSFGLEGSVRQFQRNIIQVNIETAGAENTK